uniref:EF-hand domain-containing protein n=1 Tax=Caenorhabditis japonica TaxID=281687 RepID=A0A8R1E478_CAEJA
MQSMAQQNDSLSDENVHVKELKRLFNSCDSDRNGLLDKDGLLILCEKLNLSVFTGSIVDRVLCNDHAINFIQFKDRFLLFLPEIIDLATGNQDELLISAYKSSSSLRIKDTQRLTRYDVHTICESTSELDLLSVGDVNGIFDKCAISGKVSLIDFVSQYRARQKMTEEIHFIADSYRISSVNLFETLDVHNTGEADHSAVIEYLTTSGLKLEEAIALLKEFGQPTSAMIGLVGLGNYLETTLSHILGSSPVAARAAFFCLKSLLENYRCTVREFEMRCEHMQKQIHIANQRRTLLIEELDQNQQSIEASYNNRLKEMEERCRSRVAAMEEKFRMERLEMQKEIETIEKDLSYVRHNETSLKNKLQLVERHNKRITTELDDQTEAVNVLEQENRELRSELRKKQQFRVSEDNAKIMAWKQKVELMVAHNKRLREKLRDISKNSKYDLSSDSYIQWTPPFRSQLLLIRKRRIQKGDTLSEMDSEPESIFYRRRRKRLHKKRDRMRRYENIHNVQSGSNRQNDDSLSLAAFSENSRNSLLSPRNRGMLISLNDNDQNLSSDRLLINRAKNSERNKKSTSAFDELPHVNECELEIKRLHSSMNAQKQMYEGQILTLSRRLSQMQNSEESSTRLYSFFEKYSSRAAESDAKSPNAIGVEKNGSRNRIATNCCARCIKLEPKISELNVVVGGSIKNMTIEDPVPTIMNQNRYI